MLSAFRINILSYIYPPQLLHCFTGALPSSEPFNYTNTVYIPLLLWIEDVHHAGFGSHNRSYCTKVKGIYIRLSPTLSCNWPYIGRRKQCMSDTACGAAFDGAPNTHVRGISFGICYMCECVCVSCGAVDIWWWYIPKTYALLGSLTEWLSCARDSILLCTMMYSTYNL